jgi:hypothetical protein
MQVRMQGEKEFLLTADGNVNQDRHYGNKYGDFSKN